MTTNEAIKMLEDIVKNKEQAIELSKKYPDVRLNTTRDIQLGAELFMHLIEILDGVIVTFDPCWYHNDPDYLEGRFEYVIKGELYKIAALIPKTEEDE